MLHPDFANNQLVYISYAEPGDGDAAGAIWLLEDEDDGAEGRLLRLNPAE